MSVERPMTDLSRSYTLATMSPVRPVQSPLLVGRDDLLQLAERRIAEATAGRGHLLLLAGEAGVGKTRLLQSIERRADTDGFRVAQGDLSPNDSEVPLASILDLARTMSRIESFGTLGAEILGHEGGRRGDGLSRRQLLVHEIADLILGSIHAPTLLAFDDIQWADELSLEVIGDLARRAREVPLLLVAGYRLGELPTGSIHREWRARLLSQRLAEEVRLERLTHDQTALVTTLILGTGLPAPREVVAAIYERTDGIPLHIEELLAALRDVGAVDRRTIRDAHVPDTIEDAVLARYGRLSPEARAVARAGAVIGRCFVPELLAGLLDRPLHELDAPLDELVRQSFLHPFSFLDQGYYDFRHQLLRDALYGAVQAGELRRLHARAAEFGGMLPGVSEVHASVHFERAGLGAQAYRAALIGARAASDVSSRREAFELYARAVRNAPAELSELELADLEFAYADAAASVDDDEVMGSAGRAARAHYLAAGESVRAAECLNLLINVAYRQLKPINERSRSRTRPRPSSLRCRRPTIGICSCATSTCTAQCGRWTARTSRTPSGPLCAHVASSTSWTRHSRPRTRTSPSTVGTSSTGRPSSRSFAATSNRACRPRSRWPAPPATSTSN